MVISAVLVGIRLKAHIQGKPKYIRKGEITMFAMFNDIYRYSTHDERERVEKYCSATGADWAKTFYTESGWNSFLSWERDPETWIADPSAMFFDA